MSFQVAAAPPSPPPSTIHPGSSVSQVTTEVREDKKKGKKKNNKPKGDPVPTGSIPVPPPASTPAKNPSKPVSEAVPITGWGGSDISSMLKKSPLLTFAPDAAGYFGLVDEVYANLYATQANATKTLPRSLFRYLCGLSWWYRVLFVQRQNGLHLSTQQKEFLTIFDSLPLSLPDKIAQYLANLGNFSYNGEEYRMKLPDYEFSSSIDDARPWAKGFLHTSENDHRTVNADSFWTYAQIPVPGILIAAIHNESCLASNTNQARIDPSYLAPSQDNCYRYATENIVGFQYQGLAPYHTSWRARFHNLGFRQAQYPSDVQTEYMASPSTLTFVSEQITSIPGVKVHPLKQLSLTRMGNFAQIAYLDSLDYLRTDPGLTRARSSTYSALVTERLYLAARSQIPSQLVTPIFCFGYQVQRYTEANTLRRSRYSPWFYFRTTGTGDARTGTDELGDAPFDFTDAQMNRPLLTLDSDLRAIRYYSSSLERSTVLTTAVFGQ